MANLQKHISSKQRNILLILIIIIIAAGLLFVNRHVLKHTLQGNTTKNDKTAISPEVTHGAEQTFFVTGTNYSFDPRIITVKKGNRVKIIFTSKEGKHDFYLDTFHIQTKTLNQEQKATVDFTADKIGKFPFYSSVGTDQSKGMKGVLIVE